MKRILAILLAVVCCCNVVMAGAIDDQLNSCYAITSYASGTIVNELQTVKFGRYPQKDITGNSVEDIEWIVLEKKNGEALLLSKYQLDCQPYHNTKDVVDYKNSFIRLFLNNAFYNFAFNDVEKSVISDSVNENKNREGKRSEATIDKVFLLSEDECVKYFEMYGDYKGLKYQNKKSASQGTKYAKNKDLSIDEDGDWFKGNSCYWLRTDLSNFKKDIVGTTIGIVGDVGEKTCDTSMAVHGIRPAVRIKFNQITMQDNINSALGVAGDVVGKAVGVTDDLGITNDIIKDGAKTVVDNVAPKIAGKVINGAIDKFGDNIIDKIRGNK